MAAASISSALGTSLVLPSICAGHLSEEAAESVCFDVGLLPFDASNDRIDGKACHSRLCSEPEADSPGMAASGRLEFSMPVRTDSDSQQHIQSMIEVLCEPPASGTPALQVLAVVETSDDLLSQNDPAAASAPPSKSSMSSPAVMDVVSGMKMTARHIAPAIPGGNVILCTSGRPTSSSSLAACLSPWAGIDRWDGSTCWMDSSLQVTEARWAVGAVCTASPAGAGQPRSRATNLLSDAALPPMQRPPIDMIIMPRGTVSAAVVGPGAGGAGMAGEPLATGSPAWLPCALTVWVGAGETPWQKLSPAAVEIDLLPWVPPEVSASFPAGFPREADSMAVDPSGTLPLPRCDPATPTDPLTSLPRYSRSWIRIGPVSGGGLTTGHGPSWQVPLRFGADLSGWQEPAARGPGSADEGTHLRACTIVLPSSFSSMRGASAVRLRWKPQPGHAAVAVARVALWCLSPMGATFPGSIDPVLDAITGTAAAWSAVQRLGAAPPCQVQRNTRWLRCAPIRAGLALLRVPHSGVMLAFWPGAGLAKRLSEQNDGGGQDEGRNYHVSRLPSSTRSFIDVSLPGGAQHPAAVTVGAGRACLPESIALASTWTHATRRRVRVLLGRVAKEWVTAQVAHVEPLRGEIGVAAVELGDVRVVAAGSESPTLTIERAVVAKTIAPAAPIASLAGLLLSVPAAAWHGPGCSSLDPDAEVECFRLAPLGNGFGGRARVMCHDCGPAVHRQDSLQGSRFPPLSFSDAATPGRSSFLAPALALTGCSDIGVQYQFRRWHQCDVFVCFSHSRVTLPSPRWVAQCRAHGVTCLGTIITEWETGAAEQAALSSDSRFQLGVSRALAARAADGGFHGYLLNFESPCTGGAAEAIGLVAFARLLRQALREAVGAAARVIWYDSISLLTGELKWQSALTEHNMGVLTACDAILTDYHWTAESPVTSAARLAVVGGLDERAAAAAASTTRACASNPSRIVFGIDAFGRGTFGGGKLRCGDAARVVRSAGCSIGLFAPAWPYEEAGAAGCPSPVSADALERAFWGDRALALPFEAPIAGGSGMPGSPSLGSVTLALPTPEGSHGVWWGAHKSKDSSESASVAFLQVNREAHRLEEHSGLGDDTSDAVFADTPGMERSLAAAVGWASFGCGRLCTAVAELAAGGCLGVADACSSLGLQPVCRDWEAPERASAETDALARVDVERGEPSVVFSFQWDAIETLVPVEIDNASSTTPAAGSHPLSNALLRGGGSVSARIVGHGSNHDDPAWIGAQLLVIGVRLSTGKLSAVAVWQAIDSTEGLIHRTAAMSLRIPADMQLEVNRVRRGMQSPEAVRVALHVRIAGRDCENWRGHYGARADRIQVRWTVPPPSEQAPAAAGGRASLDTAASAAAAGSGDAAAIAGRDALILRRHVGAGPGAAKPLARLLGVRPLDLPIATCFSGGQGDRAAFWLRGRRMHDPRTGEAYSWSAPALASGAETAWTHAESLVSGLEMIRGSLAALPCADPGCVPGLLCSTEACDLHLENFRADHTVPNSGVWTGCEAVVLRAFSGAASSTGREAPDVARMFRVRIRSETRMLRVAVRWWCETGTTRRLCPVAAISLDASASGAGCQHRDSASSPVPGDARMLAWRAVVPSESIGDASRQQHVVCGALRAVELPCPAAAGWAQAEWEIGLLACADGDESATLCFGIGCLDSAGVAIPTASGISLRIGSVMIWDDASESVHALAREPCIMPSLSEPLAELGESSLAKRAGVLAADWCAAASAVKVTWSEHKSGFACWFEIWGVPVNLARETRSPTVVDHASAILLAIADSSSCSAVVPAISSLGSGKEMALIVLRCVV